MSEEIYTGQLRAGTKLPARRIIAEQLCISENTVDAAYKMLVDTGYAVSIPRQGYIVSFKGEVSGDTPWESNAPEQIVFSPNGIDISHINRGNYAKLLRDIAYNDGVGIFSYPKKGGEFELRNAIAKYLYAFRNIKCSPEQLIIGAGAEYMILSLSALFDRDTAFITENPCDAHFYRTLEDNGRKVKTLPQNIGSFDFEALNASDGDVLLIEPGARFPRGKAMTEQDHERLLEWVNEKPSRYIIENGIDSEIRYNKGNTLYSSDTKGRVIYLGSFARSFCPAVKTSYMVLPYELT
jgi:GntR family transcriptional regulator/MocR family aminotransferase